MLVVVTVIFISIFNLKIDYKFIHHHSGYFYSMN